VLYACLRTGTLRERVAAANLIVDELPLFDASSDSEIATAEDAADEILNLIRQEPDDWVSRTLLEQLHWVQSDPMDRLFRDILEAGSINLVAVALQRLTFTDDPLVVEALDDLWERDLSAWIRPTLVRAARAGRPADRAGALTSLAALPFSDETLGEALRASRAGPPALREAAFRVLERLAHPDADARLIAALDEPLPDHLRVVAAEGLTDSRHPDATAGLVRLLHALPSDTKSCLASAAARVLHNRDDPDAVPGLLDLEGPSSPSTYPTIARLVAYLSRDRTRATAGHMPVASCRPEDTGPEGAADLDADEIRPFRVVPPPPLLTVRCWEGPDLPGDPDEWLRVPAGTPVSLAGHFERPAESWVEIDGADVDCWVPLTQVAKGAAGVPGATRGVRPRFEFNLWSEDLETLPAARLMAAGLLEVIDPGDEVTGAALTLDPSVPEQAALLRALLGALPVDHESPLRLAIEALVEPTPSIDGSPRAP
jgi:hypothetical protein